MSLFFRVCTNYCKPSASPLHIILRRQVTNTAIAMAPKRKKAARSNSASGETDPALKHPSPKRAKEIDADPPYEHLEELLEKNNTDVKVRNVLHWFRSKDLRQEDNTALHAASQKAKEGGGNLITLYLHSPKDVEWHGTSPARIDFILESLRVLRDQLKGKNIPLAIVEAEERNQKKEKVMEFIKEHDVSHVYANMEYEVDELRRDIGMCKAVQNEKDLSFEVMHDQTAVHPGILQGSNGGPIKVFTPYHKAWLQETKSDPSWFDTVPAPEANDKKATSDLKALFDSTIPSPPENKQFDSKEERDRVRKLWPPGHDAGMDRLNHFLNKKVKKYAETRSTPIADSSSRLSPYFASGIVSVREVLATTKKWNNGAHFDAGDVGVDSWVREIVFREFYRHMMIFVPHGSMNMPQNVKFDFVQWEDDPEGWKKWCEGTTGVPWVDAGMRQLAKEKYMHNRLRMNVSSYLRANLLIDYRKGERFFAENLVDWVSLPLPSAHIFSRLCEHF